MGKKIYFEQQEASLCGQHLLNNLLQGYYFDAVALSDIALSLDSEEQGLGIAVDRFRNHSQNVDESGNFSVQVLQVALNSSNIVLERGSTELAKAKKIIEDQSQRDSAIENIAFVFNQESHWYCTRFLHGQYWILDSIKPRPEPVSRTHLTAYIAQVQAAGWDVFVTQGKLPLPNPDDETKNWIDLEEEKNSQEKKVKVFSGKGYSLKDDDDGDDDPELRQAILASITDYDASSLSKVALEPEPGPEEKDVILIQLILPPQGKRVRRKFKGSLTVEQVFAWANTFGEVSNKIRSIQKSEDNKNIDATDLISSLGNGCSLRVVLV